MTYDPEIEKLLPWYEKGLLEEKDHKAVDAYLADHPKMRSQLDLIAEEAVAVEQLHAALGAPSSGGLDRLLADIDATQAEGRSGKSSQMNRLLGVVREAFGSFSTPALQIAGVAAAVIIVAQAFVIGGLMDWSWQNNKSEIATFTTAAGPQGNGADVAASNDFAVYLVAFRKDASIETMNALLKSLSAKIVFGPKAGGFYEIAIDRGLLPAGGEDAVLEALKTNKELIQFASKSQ